MGRAREVAREIAANAPLAVQAAKRMMRMGLNETFPDHVHHVYLQLLPLFKTHDMQEGIKAFMEKREAEVRRPLIAVRSIRPPHSPSHPSAGW